ncbi:oligopeptide/dipeptide ABC transporter ATPase [Alcaligenes faecalis subsp. faecalis NCIB 8687]|nr:oligopeptide/dipeptide ABC transporter ATPase [Alcaligenes faecalis subsp. faecalis NCIB 8687]
MGSRLSYQATLTLNYDLSVIRYLCTRVLVMKNGEVVEQGNTAEVFADPQHPYTRAFSRMASTSSGLL